MKMEELIKNSIDARYNAFMNYYDITDKSIQKKIDDLFKKINELGESSKDVMDFESKFAASPLNGEYTSLFTEIASNSKPCVSHDAMVEPVVKDDKEYLVEEIESDAKYVMEDLSMPARRAAREAFDSKMRDTPLGQIEQASNTAYLFKRIFNKHKKGE